MIGAFATSSCPHCQARWQPRPEIGGYALLQQVARSGLGLLFQSVDPATGGLVLVKILRPCAGTTSEDFDRFSKELALVCSYEHPHWVRVLNGGLEEGLAWFAMEWLPEGSLAALLAQRGRLEQIEALDFAAQIAVGLAAAETVGMLHCDIEPNNLLFVDSTTLKIGDFAQTVFYIQVALQAETVWGRLACVPPERLNRGDEDARSDIYTLGALLFLMLQGTPPYGDETIIEAMQERVTGNPLVGPGIRSSIHRTTAKLLEKLLHSDPAHRFQTWDEVIDAIAQTRSEVSDQALLIAQRKAVRAVLRPAPPASVVKQPVVIASVNARAHPRGMWVTVAMILIMGGVVAAFAWQAYSQPSTKDQPKATASLPPTVAAPLTVAPAVAALPSALQTAPPPPTPPKTTSPGAAQVEGRFDWAGWKYHSIAPASQITKGKGNTIINPQSGALRIYSNQSGMVGANDEASLFSVSLDKDFTLTCHYVVNTGLIGIMAREGLESNRPAIGLVVDPRGQVCPFVRSETGAAATAHPEMRGERKGWLKLDRVGAKLTTSYSKDGQDWKAMTSLVLSNPAAKIPVGFTIWSGPRLLNVAAIIDQVTLDVKN